jgi:hypothetical protein
MSTATIQDYRRTDLRCEEGGDPFWIKSRVVDGFATSSLKDKACVLFSFPTEGQQVIIREIAVRVLRAFTALTTLELGLYTLATDGVETGNSATVVFDNALVEANDILPTTVGWYYPTAGSFVDSRVAGAVIEGGNLVVGTAVNVPAIVLTPKVAVGQVQILMMISVVPM